MSSAASVRPRRSVLYMPGSNARALEKAKTLAADGFIFDLEDAVAPDMKGAARTQVCEAVRAGGYGKRELVIRVNGLDTPWGADDIKAASAAGPNAILLPKVESAREIEQAVDLLELHNAPAKTQVWAMMETPRAMLRSGEIAASHERLTCFVMGTSDLVKDLHAMHTPLRLPLVTSLGLCLLAARAEGLTILDGVYLDLENAVGFHESCLQGLEMGFDGKTLIHPRQVQPANDVFAPSKKAVETARRIIDAFAAAEAEGKAVAVVDGKLVENLHVEDAKRKVALSDAIKALEEA